MKILIVEDEPDNIDLLRLVLEDAGHEITGAFTAEDGLLRASAERFDVVLMDLSLPGAMDGPEAVRRLRASNGYARCPVLAVTAFSNPEMHERAREAGCDAVLLKPITDIAAFVRVVEQHASV